MLRSLSRSLAASGPAGAPGSTPRLLSATSINSPLRYTFIQFPLNEPNNNFTLIINYFLRFIFWNHIFTIRKGIFKRNSKVVSPNTRITRYLIYYISLRKGIFKRNSKVVSPNTRITRTSPLIKSSLSHSALVRFLYDYFYIYILYLKF